MPDRTCHYTEAERLFSVSSTRPFPHSAFGTPHSSGVPPIARQHDHRKQRDCVGVEGLVAVPNNFVGIVDPCKCFGADVAVQVTSEAVQIFGGYGYVKDYVVEKLYRDAKVFQIYEGTSEIQRTIIARDVLQGRAH